MVLTASEQMGALQSSDVEACHPCAASAARQSEDARIGWRQCAELGAVIVVALALALGAPLTTAVYGLILFGALHNYFEIRYLIGRFGGLLRGHLGEWVLVLLSAIVLARALPLGALGRPAEILVGYLLLSALLAYRLHARRYLLAGALLAVGVAAALSLSFPDEHFVAITHLHNVLPLAFIWEWSARPASTGSSRVFRGLTITWALVLPAVLLTGFMPLASAVGPTSQPVGLAAAGEFLRALAPTDGAAVVPTISLPSADPGLAGRLLTIFAFLQLLHYYVWCRFFPSVGRDDVRRADDVLRSATLPSGRRLKALALGLVAVSVGLFWTDLRLGRSVYGALAGYHAYLEYVVLLLFVLVSGGGEAAANLARGED
jgi:hypothetical protein